MPIYKAIAVILLQHSLNSDGTPQVLLQQRMNTGFFDGHWSIVTGHVEPGEVSHQAAKRELIEELGIGLESQDLKLLFIAERKSLASRLYVDFVYLLDRWNGQVTNVEIDRCSGLQWVEFNNIANYHMVPHVAFYLDRFVSLKVQQLVHLTYDYQD